jgi:hypothetical protein
MQSKSLCLKTLFSSLFSWNDQKKYKNYKISYLVHCPFCRTKLSISNQIHFYVFLIGSEHEPVLVRSNCICQSQNVRLKTFYPKAFLLCHQWRRQASELGGGGQLRGKLIFGGGGEDRIFEKVLLFAHAVVSGFSLPPQVVNTLGISAPFKIFAPHICDVVYSNHFVILSSY